MPKTKNVVSYSLKPETIKKMDHLAKILNWNTSELVQRILENIVITQKTNKLIEDLEAKKIEVLEELRSQSKI